MMGLFLGFLLVVVVLFAGSPGVATQTCGKLPIKPSGNFKIAFIGEKSLVVGCGCSFSFPNEMRKKTPRLIFSSNIDDVNKGWMNIDGKDVELSPIAMTYSNGTQKVGSRATQTYAGSGIKVSAVLRATRVCARDDEQCESTDYSGTFRICKGRLRRTIKLTGACGC